MKRERGWVQFDEDSDEFSRLDPDDPYRTSVRNMYMRDFLQIMVDILAEYPPYVGKGHTKWIAILLQEHGVDPLVDTL
jgi:hypothetical protein